jgi:hypothetical protein
MTRPLLRHIFFDVRCRLGQHRWQVDRYLSLGGHIVDGRICRDCTRTHPERVIVQRFDDTEWDNSDDTLGWINLEDLNYRGGGKMGRRRV